jgi:predicted phosphodiesterase
MNLGELTGPLLLFGGPYSNLDAVEALMQEADKRGIPPEHIICTGDVVAYCSEAAATTDAIKRWGIHVLMGNCEQSFGDNADDCGCGFMEGSSCDLLSAQWFYFSKAQLTVEHRQWFSQLPTTIRFIFNGKHCQVVHGSATEINQFLFFSDSDDCYRQQFAVTDADIIIAGHSGIPFSKKVDNKLWHNAGAIGMPANDGSPHTWFSIMSSDKNRIQLTHQVLHYNYQQAQQKMVAAGINEGYASALTSGLWPSMDVLPEQERRQQGSALKTTSIFF